MQQMMAEGAGDDEQPGAGKACRARAQQLGVSMAQRSAAKAANRRRDSKRTRDRGREVNRANRNREWHRRSRTCSSSCSRCRRMRRMRAVDAGGGERGGAVGGGSGIGTEWAERWRFQRGRMQPAERGRIEAIRRSGYGWERGLVTNSR